VPRPAIDEAELDRRFIHHVPNETRLPIHMAARHLFREFATEVNDLLPGESREKSLALTALEEASFWAHAHVARNVK
jgi:hypothetical protein